MTALEETPAGLLTSEQLLALAWCKRSVENAEPLPQLDWERERTPQERVYSFAEWGRSIGADDAMIACEVTRALLGRGYSADEAAELLREVGVAEPDPDIQQIEQDEAA